MALTCKAQPARNWAKTISVLATLHSWGSVSLNPRPDTSRCVIYDLFHESIASLQVQGTWVWLADHDLDSATQGQITLYSGRGILSESEGPVWMIGTACQC